MGDTIVGVMWNYNEGDILEEIIEAAVKTDINCLWIADEGSSDNSWKIIEAAKERHSKIEYVKCGRIKGDKGQRQHLLDEVRRRYKPENTWMQIIESDIMILDTSVRDAISRFAIDDLSVCWHTINCHRRDWSGVDKYPNWEHSIKELMDLGSYMESMLYTFRPLPKLKYRKKPWRPWPQNFTAYTGNKLDVRAMHEDAPLLAHYGYRGPTHFYQKYKGMGDCHSKYRNWRLTSVESVRRTVPWFNGEYVGKIVPVSREGWKVYLEKVMRRRNKKKQRKVNARRKANS